MDYSIEKCPICGEEFTRNYETKEAKCDLCGKDIVTNFSCISGHHLCNDCIFMDDYIGFKKVCINTKSKNPIEIAEEILDETNTSVLGCKNYLAASMCVAAAEKNTSGDQIDFDKTLDRIKNRVMLVPTSMCKSGGFCGLPMAIGASFLAAASEKSENIAEVTKIANRLSAYCMEMLINPEWEGSSDCCIRNSIVCVISTIKYLNHYYWIDMELPDIIRCNYSGGNPRCNKEKCLLYLGIGVDELYR